MAARMLASVRAMISSIPARRVSRPYRAANSCSLSSPTRSALRWARRSPRTLSGVRVFAAMIPTMPSCSWYSFQTLVGGMRSPSWK